MTSIVYNSDCLTGMKELPDNFFDLALCDIPYGMLVAAAVVLPVMRRDLISMDGN